MPSLSARGRHLGRDQGGSHRSVGCPPSHNSAGSQEEGRGRSVPGPTTEGKYADFLLTVLADVAQLERDIMDEKRRDGIAAARANGIKFGRPRLVSTKLQVEASALKQRGVAMPEIARRLNLGVSTIYRLLAEQKEREGAWAHWSPAIR